MESLEMWREGKEEGEALMREGGTEEEKKVEVERESEDGWTGSWRGYDELKMTLSGSLVSKDHSVC